MERISVLCFFYLQICVEDPYKGADGRVTAGFEDHKSPWTVLSPEAGNEDGREDREVKEMKLTKTALLSNRCNVLNYWNQRQKTGAGGVWADLT